MTYFLILMCRVAFLSLPGNHWFSVVQVSHEDDLWKTFLSDFSARLGNLGGAPHRPAANPDTVSYIAFHPCWVLRNGLDVVATTRWIAGCAGAPCMGGGKADCWGSAVDGGVGPLTLQLAGLAVSSHHLVPGIVFWIDLTMDDAG